MNRYAVLLRGVNLGARNKVPMADLRTGLTEHGYADVASYLQSGNIVLTSDESPDEIATSVSALIAQRYGVTSPCLIRTGPELQAVIDAHPLSAIADNGSRMFALFLSADLDPARLAERDPRILDPDGVRIGDRVVYQWCPDGAHQAPNVSAYLERHHKITVTGRNWNTLTALADLLR